MVSLLSQKAVGLLEHNGSFQLSYLNYLIKAEDLYPKVVAAKLKNIYERKQKKERKKKGKS
jgi:hypothetical protein